MATTPELNIDHVAKLARLALTPEEKRMYSAQLGDVLKYIEHLSEVNVDGIEPTAHAFPISNVWREDEAGPALPVEKALMNAPAQRDNMVSVPTVIE